MNYSGNFFCMNLAKDLVVKFAELMPKAEFVLQENAEPKDYHTTLNDLNAGRIDFFVWPKEDLPKPQNPKTPKS